MVTDNKLIVKGLVLEASSKTGAGTRGPWTKFSFLVSSDGGERHYYTTFDEVEGPTIQAGLVSTFEYKLADNSNNPERPYRNITRFLNKNQPLPAGASANQSVAPNFVDPTRQSIEKQTSLKEANHLVGLKLAADSSSLSLEQAATEALKIASLYHAWLDASPEAPGAPQSNGIASQAATQQDPPKNVPLEISPDMDEEGFKAFCKERGWRTNTVSNWLALLPSGEPLGVRLRARIAAVEGVTYAQLAQECIEQEMLAALGQGSLAEM